MGRNGSFLLTFLLLLLVGDIKVQDPDDHRSYWFALDENRNNSFIMKLKALTDMASFSFIPFSKGSEREEIAKKKKEVLFQLLCVHDIGEFF